MIYLDESGIDQGMYRLRGRAPRGQKIYGEVSGKRSVRESFIAALWNKKIIAPMGFQGTCNASLFNTWIEKILIPELQPGQVIIMDNAAFHKSETTKKLIENAGCELMFLPPYSPDFNPIETCWANIKRKIRNTAHNFNSITQTIDYVFANIL